MQASTHKERVSHSKYALKLITYVKFCGLRFYSPLNSVAVRARNVNPLVGSSPMVHFWGQYQHQQTTRSDLSTAGCIRSTVTRDHMLICRPRLSNCAQHKD